MKKECYRGYGIRAGALTMLVIVVLSPCYSQTVGLKEMLSHTRCMDYTCFRAFMESRQFDSVATAYDGTDVYHRFESKKYLAGDSMRDSKVVIHYAVLQDGVFNSSITTNSTRYVAALTEELRQLGFVETTALEKTDHGVWYRSPQFKVDLLVEKLVRTVDMHGQIFWHIGFVWTKS